MKLLSLLKLKLIYYRLKQCSEEEISSLLDSLECNEDPISSDLN